MIIEPRQTDRQAAHQFPAVRQLLLCDGQVRLLIQHLFDILNGRRGGDSVRPRPDVVVVNGEPSQPKKTRQGLRYFQ